MAGVASVLAVGAAWWLSPDVGPPVQVTPVAPSEVVQGPERVAPKVAAAIPASRPSEARAVEDDGQYDDLDEFGVPFEDAGNEPLEMSDEDRAKHLRELEQRIDRLDEALDDAEDCATVDDSLRDQLEKLSAILDDMADDPSGARVGQGLTLIRAYQPRLDRLLAAGDCGG